MSLNLNLVVNLLFIFLICLNTQSVGQSNESQKAEDCQGTWKYKPLKKEIKLEVYLSTGKVQYGNHVYPNLILGVTEKGDTIAAVDLDYWGPILAGESLTIVPRKWTLKEKKYRPNFVLNSKYPEYSNLYCAIKNAYYCQFSKEKLKPKAGPTLISDCTPENSSFNNSDSIIYQIIDDYYCIKIKTSSGGIVLNKKYDCKRPTILTPTYLWSNEKILCLQNACLIHEDRGPFCGKQTYIKLQDGFKKLNRENVIATDKKNYLIAYAEKLENETFLIVENLLTEEKQRYSLGKIPCPFINNCLQEIRFENGTLKGAQVIQKDISIEINVMNK